MTEQPGPAQPAATDPDARRDGTTDDLPEQIRVRLEKRQRLLDAGGQAYPVVVPRTHTLRQVRERYPDLETGA